MNRKTIALIFCLFLLVFLISACKSNTQNNADQQTNSQSPTSTGELSVNGSPPVTTETLPENNDDLTSAGDDAQDPLQSKAIVSDKYFKELISGLYHMKIKMNGIPGMTGVMDIYAKDGMQATRLEGELGSMRVIHRDNKVYSIMESQKVYVVTDVKKGMNASRIITDGMNYLSSGSAEFDGRELPYDEYSNKEGYTMRLFTDGDKQVGLQNIYEDVVTEMVIIEMNKSIPEGIFDIPSDYREIIT